APRLEVRPFSEQQIALLRTFADQAVIAIRNARLFEQVQRRTEEISEALEQQTATSDILRVMAEWPADVQPVLEVIADHAAKLCDGLFTAVYRTDGQQVYEAAARDFTTEGLKLHASEYPRPLQMDSSLSSRAILTGQSIHIPDFQSAPEVPELARRYSAALGMRSVYFEPMMKEGKAIGAIAVGRRSAGPFSAKHIELLQTFAHQAVIAIENVRLFNESARLLKETEERAAELAAVNTVSQALVAETDLDRTISLIGDQMRATFAADIVYVALVDAQTNLIAFPYQHGQELSPMRLGEGITSKIIESGQPILINQELDHRIGELGKQRMGREARSYLGVPITAGGEPIGVISVQSTQQENAFTEDDARLLSTIAANAGAAIRAARLHAETRRRAQEMATLAEIGNEIAATRELEPVLERIAAHAKEIMRVRDIAILLRDPDGEAFHNKVALGRYSEEMKALVVRPGIGLGGSILAGGVAELINDPEHDPRRITVPGTPDFEEDPECLMGAPLVSRGEVIGAIMVWRLRRDGLFTQNELDFLVSVGRQTTIAIESARLYLETRRR
ncbi:MAG TPA: GAF domain-containing protein, partial [Anaerolineales bacterium]|nr:GAF domain-containing protein [Anaerolineales bacterium]